MSTVISVDNIDWTPLTQPTSYVVDSYCDATTMVTPLDHGVAPEPVTAGLELTPGMLSEEKMQAHDGVKSILVVAHEAYTWTLSWSHGVIVELRDEPDADPT